MSGITKDKRFGRSWGYSCPHPDCKHFGEVITVVHCRTHGMERKDLFKKYGEPQPLAIDGIAFRNNSKMPRTIYNNNTPVVSQALKGTAAKYDK